MEITPQRVRSADFKTVRKGADPDEVKVFLNDVADELERAQNQSTAMEARARAAVARLQEVSGAAAPAQAPAPTPAVEASVDEAETISRTLLLAQRTADTTVAEARSEATRILGAANDESATTLDSTREMAAQLLDEARSEARRVGEAERVAIAGEVESLKARRDFLESDVEQLELFLTEQRSRLRDAATSLIDISERVPGGLGAARPPLLSASDDDSDGSPNPDDDIADLADIDDLDDIAGDERAATPADDLVIVTEIADTEHAEHTESTDEPTQSMPVVGGADEIGTGDRGDEFRFSFDDGRR